MFIERSAAKIRLVRTLFVLLAVVPCAAVAGWAAFRHSTAFRMEFERDVQRLLGAAVTIDGLKHVRPGALRCGQARLRSADGAVEVSVRDLEVEISSDELRLRIPELICGPDTAALLARIARAWLAEPVRFTRNWVIDIGRLGWAIGERPPGAPGRNRAVRVECVAAGESRAVRIVRSASRGEADEIRVIVGDPARRGAAGTAELHAIVREPVPWPIVRALLGSGAAGGLSFGDDAIISGTCDAVALAAGWSGQAAGRIDGIDLHALGGSYRLTGTATVDLDRLEWAADRVVRLEAACAVGRGRVDQALLDALVAMGGCRPGPAHRSLGGEPVRQFDECACRITMDGSGMRIQAALGRAGAMIRRQGLALIDEPPASLPLDRLAWLVSPAPGPVIPADPAAAWLMAIMPPAAASPAAGDRPPPSTGPSQQRNEF